MEQEHQFIDYIEQSIIKNWDKDGGCYNSYFHNSTLFMAANVRILSEYIVSLQR